MFSEMEVYISELQDTHKDKTVYVGSGDICETPLEFYTKESCKFIKDFSFILVVFHKNFLAQHSN